MSYCAIIPFKFGKPVGAIKFSNAWGGAARIWTALYDKYLKDPNIDYDNWLADFNKNNGQRLWQLSERSDLSDCERIALLATYDYAIVRCEHFVEFCDHLREFAKHYPVSEQTTDHLASWADTIESLDSDVQAIGFYHTSVSENLWNRYDEEREEMKPYDLSAQEDSRHFEIYEEFCRMD